VTKSVIERDAVRAIVLAEPAAVLLMRIRSPEGKLFWITPGGGVDPGESTEAALRRELREELGIEPLEVGPLVWRRQHTFTWGERRLCQRELFHVVRMTRFEPRMSDAAEAAWYDRFQWWTLAELREPTEEVVPSSIADIVSRYLAHGSPSEPPDWEVLVD